MNSAPCRACSRLSIFWKRSQANSPTKTSSPTWKCWAPIIGASMARRTCIIWSKYSKKIPWSAKMANTTRWPATCWRILKTCRPWVKCWNWTVSATKSWKQTNAALPAWTYAALRSKTRCRSQLVTKRQACRACHTVCWGLPHQEIPNDTFLATFDLAGLRCAGQLRPRFCPRSCPRDQAGAMANRQSDELARRRHQQRHVHGVAAAGQPATGSAQEPGSDGRQQRRGHAHRGRRWGRARDGLRDASHGGAPANPYRTAWKLPVEQCTGSRWHERGVQL